MSIKKLLLTTLCLTTATAIASPAGWYQCVNNNPIFIAILHVVKAKAPHSYDVTWEGSHANKSKVPTYNYLTKWFVIGNVGISSYIGHDIHTGRISAGTAQLLFKNNKVNFKHISNTLSANGKVSTETGHGSCSKIKHP